MYGAPRRLMPAKCSRSKHSSTTGASRCAAAISFGVFSCAPVLQRVERRPAVGVERDDLAVEDHRVDGLGLQVGDDFGKGDGADRCRGATADAPSPSWTKAITR